MLCSNPIRVTGILCLLLCFLSNSAWAQRDPDQRRERRPDRQRVLRGDTPRQRTGLKRAAKRNDLLFLFKADLSLRRLLFAQALSDANLSIAELDSSRQVLQEAREWVQAQGPDVNNPKSQEALGHVDEALRFVELRLQAEFGLVNDLPARLAHFLTQDYPPGQKVSLLLFAAESQANRGRFKEANVSLQSALKLAQDNPQGMSAINTYALQSMKAKLQHLGGVRFSPLKLIQEFETAAAPLARYRPKLNPLEDVHWLVGRNATAFWTSELGRLGKEGEPSLAQLMSALDQLERQSQNPWDENLLAKNGIVFPYAAYLKFFAEAILKSSIADQRLLVLEAMPEQAAREAVPLAGILELEAQLNKLPQSEKHFINPALGPNYQTFPISEVSLVAELLGRVQLQKARHEVDPNRRFQLLQDGFESILKSDDATAKVGYFLALAEVMANDLKRGDDSVKVWEEALGLSKENGLLLGSIKASERLASYFESRKDWAQAKQFAEVALQQIEAAIPYSGRDSTTATDLQRVSTKMSAIVARSALATDDTEAALSALSQGHQYETAASQVNAAEAASSELIEVEQKKQQVALLTQKVDQLKAMPASETRDSLLQESEQLLADSRADFLLESRNIRQKHSTLYSSALRFDPLNLPDVQEGLTVDSAVVQYFPTEEELFIFLVTKDKLRLRSVKVKKTDLDEQCNAFLKALSRFASLNQVISMSQSLNQLLMVPIQEDIVGTKRLVIIPAGSLNFIPFGALYDGDGKPLISKYAFLELAKPTDFAKIAQSRPVTVNSVTAFANATLDLPATSKEGRDIVALFDGSRLFEGNEATKKNFIAHGGETQALHLATHGRWDTQDSLQNYLQLANGEKVAQKEILTLGLQGTALVTLSACNTAVANDKESDYVASLAEAFWLAGCPSVVASLWAVEDQSTGVLMTEFYDGLRGKKSKVEALRDAQLSMYGKPEFSHPSYWSGFVLFGDWR
jgi:CHAT domain-containing protein